VSFPDRSSDVKFLFSTGDRLKFLFVGPAFSQSFPEVDSLGLVSCLIFRTLILSSLLLPKVYLPEFCPSPAVPLGNKFLRKIQVPLLVGDACLFSREELVFRISPSLKEPSVIFNFPSFPLLRVRRPFLHCPRLLPPQSEVRTGCKSSN